MSEESATTVRTLFKGGSVLLAGIVLDIGISFVAKLLIAQELGRYDYGAVSLGVTVTAITTTLVLLGVNTGIARYLPRYDTAEQRRGVLVSGFQLALPMALLAGTVLFLAAPVLAADVFGDPTIAPILRVFAAAIPVYAVVHLSVSGIQGLQLSIPKVVVRNVTLPIIRFLGFAVAILLGLQALGVAWAYLASYTAAALVGLYYLSARTPMFDRHTEYTPIRRELLSFSLPLVVSAAMTIVFSDVDMLMLGALIGPAPVGVYNVVYPIAQLLTVTLSAFGFIFTPVVSELHAADEHDQLRRIYQVVTKWITMATLPVFLVMATFPDRVIDLTFGAEYVAGAPALSVLAVGFFVHAFSGLNGNTLTSIGRTRLIMYDNVAVAAVNLVLNVLLIPPYGFLGAAVATTASYVLLNALYLAQLYRTTGVQPFTPALLRPAFIGVAIMAAFTAVARAYLPMTVPTLVGLLVAFLVAYGLAILRFGGVEQEEVMLVLSIEERFDVDLGPMKTVAKRLM